MSSDEAGFTNRLMAERSPYLLQHARNPVDWYPWGEEAFERARREQRPIFLSIGYSTCHWCHVMERESFEDPEVAGLLNDGFVSIKVDREERPEIDDQYMAVCQLLTGQGGWPLTIVMAPDKRPFFAGTYFPKYGRFGRPGMVELLPELMETWRSRRDEVLAAAERVTEALRRTAGESGAGVLQTARESDLDAGILKRSARALERAFDSQHGGFGTAPKFPTPHNLIFLLRYAERVADPEIREMALSTLRAMRRGGIFDQLGFGFHRYSTDASWLVPHFEKMLYDQALLALAYTEAFEATGEVVHAMTVREICTYVLRDLADERGGFYCAEDADSEGEEGRFYLWTEADVREVAGEQGLAIARSVYGVRGAGNYIDELAGRRTGANILHLTTRAPGPETADDHAGVCGGSAQEDDLRKKLLQARTGRIRPGLDDKILTGWNGLMIAALARAGAVMGEDAYLIAAARAADFLLRELELPGRGLLRRYRDGESAIPAVAQDYAFFIWGLLELYEATFDARWLSAAKRLALDALERFWDTEGGGFYIASRGSGDLLVRRKDSYDGALPSANSVAAMNLIRLARLTGDGVFEQRAGAIFRWARDAVEAAPTGHTHMLCALDLALGPVREIVVVGDPEDEDTRALLGAIRAPYLPRSVTLLVPPGREGDLIRSLAPYSARMERIDGRATAYVCSNFTCQRPTTDPMEVTRLLSSPAGTPSPPG